MVGHFFPWWMENAYAGHPVEEGQWMDKERRACGNESVATGNRSDFEGNSKTKFRRIAAQEYAESAKACFWRAAMVFFIWSASRDERWRCTKQPKNTV